MSPYTKSARNHDAPIFVLLQDWSSEDRLNGPLDQDAIEHGHTPSLPTNRRLNQLLGRFFNVTLADTYATNLFPFIKPGSLSAPIPFKDLVRAAREYALPQISIVGPRLVICLGSIPSGRFNRRRTGAPPPTSRRQSPVPSSSVGSCSGARPIPVLSVRPAETAVTLIASPRTGMRCARPSRAPTA